MVEEFNMVMRFEDALAWFYKMVSAYNQIVKIKGEASYEKGFLDAFLIIFREEFGQFKKDYETVNKEPKCESCGE